MSHAAIISLRARTERLPPKLFAQVASAERHIRSALVCVLERLAGDEVDADDAAEALLELLDSTILSCEQIRCGSYALLRDTVGGGE